MRLIAFLCAACLALPAQAQSWATQELCDVRDPRVHDEVFAPLSRDELQAAAAEIPNGIGRFWKITSPEGAVSHLWGTFHSNHPLILDLPQPLVEAIETARVVAVESDFSDVSRSELTRLYNNEHRWLKQGELEFNTLDLPPELEAWIRDRFIAIGWRWDGPDILNLPAIAETLLGDPCSDFASGLYPIQDFRIQMLGDLAGAEVIGLEDHMRFYTRFAGGRDTDTLKAMIARYGAYLNPDITTEDYASGFALYLEGRLGEWMAWDNAYLDGLFPGGQGAEWATLSDAYLLTERNVDFVNAGLPELERGGVLIAVGAFHLPGRTGMIRLLRGAGYTVERIALDGEAPS